MRRDVWIVDRLVEQSLKEKKFESEEECAVAMRYWLAQKGYTDLSHSASDDRANDDRSSPVEDDAHSMAGISRSEGAQLQYDILRERDA